MSKIGKKSNKITPFASTTFASQIHPKVDTHNKKRKYLVTNLAEKNESTNNDGITINRAESPITRDKAAEKNFFNNGPRTMKR